MPFSHEHSARIVDPDVFADFRRENAAFGPHIDVVYGIRGAKGAKAEIQSIRFDKTHFTPEQAEDWLEEHGIEYLEMHPASADVPKNNPERAWLPLRLIMPAIPEMERLGVSEVARSNRGFLTAYEDAHGDPRRLGMAPTGESWVDRRNNFIARHYAQVVAHGEALWDDHGNPTRRHLALVAWAWTPHRKRWERWLRDVGSRPNPAPAEYPDNPIGRAMKATDDARREEVMRTVTETERKLSIAQKGVQEYRAAHWGVMPDVIYEVDQPHLPRNQPIVEMGKLRELWIQPAQGKPYILEFDDNFTMLGFTRDTVQRLYIILSDEDRQDIAEMVANDSERYKVNWYNLPDLHAYIGGRQAKYPIDDVPVVCLGKLTHVMYLTEKKGDNVSEYKHEMGEYGGRKPLLCADADGHLYIAGGSYSVPNRGIIH